MTDHSAELLRAQVIEECARVVESQVDASCDCKGCYYFKLAADGIRALATAPQDATSNAEVRVVFDGPPSADPPRFVEVETPDGKSISWGRWEQRGRY